ncbi:TPA: ArsR family transcriptional regulator [Candidatus Peregrinibacteria bacterium]|nr:ArsR family transcriptional regulator [Candidatus Peregrinibacteria bacterium]
MTLDAAEIDLSKTFEPGQGYVALSRIKSIDGLSLSGMNNVALMVDEQVLSVDRKFKAHSIAVEEKFLEFSDEKKQEMFDTFISIKGGTLDKKEIAEEKVFIEKEEKQKNEAIGSALKKIPSISTFQLTKELIEKEKNISELMKERGLTKATIMNHLEKLVETKSLEKSALEYLKPGIDLIDTVQEVVDEINADKKEENFSEDGKMRLTPIFKMLDGEVEFEEIRLALIFID